MFQLTKRSLLCGLGLSGLALSMQANAGVVLNEIIEGGISVDTSGVSTVLGANTGAWYSGSDLIVQIPATATVREVYANVQGNSGGLSANFANYVEINGVLLSQGTPVVNLTARNQLYELDPELFGITAAGNVTYREQDFVEDTRNGGTGVVGTTLIVVFEDDVLRISRHISFGISDSSSVTANITGVPTQDVDNKYALSIGVTWECSDEQVGVIRSNGTTISSSVGGRDDGAQFNTNCGSQDWNSLITGGSFGVNDLGVLVGTDGDALDTEPVGGTASNSRLSDELYRPAYNKLGTISLVYTQAPNNGYMQNWVTALEIDTDQDGVLDPSDPCPFDAADDSDNDGSCDSDDLCIGDDGVGDSDLDGVCDDLDPCISDNPDDADADGLCDSSTCSEDYTQLAASWAEESPSAAIIDAIPEFANHDYLAASGSFDPSDVLGPNLLPATFEWLYQGIRIDASPPACSDFVDVEVVWRVEKLTGTASGQELLIRSWDGAQLGAALTDARDLAVGTVSTLVSTERVAVADLADYRVLLGVQTDDATSMTPLSFRSLDVAVTVTAVAGTCDIGDLDADGSCNPDDLCPNDALDDADGDGVCGDIDLCEGSDDALDFDGDGVPDGCDPCPKDVNDDSDNDGSCDSADLCVGNDASGDADGDGVCDDTDPCPADVNDDSDNDGSCDSVDLCVGNDTSGDTDGDGVCDDTDPCPADALDDSDNDGSCDSVDLCVGDDATGDPDADGLCNDSDPCPADVGNDSDNDGSCDSVDLCVGDDASGDADSDGVCDDSDPCPADPLDDSDNDGSCDSVDLCVGNDASGDTDADGTCDDTDACPLDALDDSDGDGVCDSADVCQGSNDNIDTDGDGVPNGCDSCDGDIVDTDLDGVPDACDVCPLDLLNDSDGDGSCDSDDLCALGDDRLDLDLDGVPDACDSCLGDDAVGDADLDGTCDDLDVCADSDDSLDADLDGVPDGCDICALGDDAVDGDLDGVPDACDDCPLDVLNDSDGDGVCDSVDLCAAGDDLLDADSDGVPDACDDCVGDDASGDADADGVCDDLDVCAGDDLLDADSDGVPDACDVCASGDDALDADGDDVPDACDVCEGDDATGDSDSDGVCDDEDLCEGDDSLGDPDGDGQCGEPDDTGSVDTDVPDGETVWLQGSGCGCSSAPTGLSFSWLPAVFGFLLVRRRVSAVRSDA